MSPAARVRVLVGAAAVLAASVVAGVVLLTRQAPAQPKSRCNGPASPFLVPTVPTKSAAAIRAAFALRGKRAALALEPVAQAAPKDAVVQFNYGIALFCAGYLNEASTAFRTAKTVGRDTIYEM